MCVQNLTCVALSLSEIIGGGQKIRQSLAMHTLHIPQNVLEAFHTNYSSMCTRFPAISYWGYGWELRTSNLGKGGQQGVGNGGLVVPSERALVSSYRPSIVTSHLSLYFTHFRDISAFVFHCATQGHSK